MAPHTRAMIAAAAHAAIGGAKVAGLYDHAAGVHRRIAAECRGNRLQGHDGDRDARFGGTLPEIHDAGDAAFVSLEVDGATARGYDRGSAGFYAATVSGRLVQLYDYADEAWYAFDVETA